MPTLNFDASRRPSDFDSRKVHGGLESSTRKTAAITVCKTKPVAI